MASGAVPTVLVVDDDADVLEMTAATLEELGLSVLRAPGGKRALRMLNENPGVALLITDIVMPDITGWHLAHEAKQFCPDIKIVYTSGFLRNLPKEHPGLRLGPLLRKPWKGRDLEQQVFQALRGAAA